MNLKSLILGGAMAAALCLPAQAAVLVNAGFETGDLTGWHPASGVVEVLTDTDDALVGSIFSEHFQAAEGAYFAQLTAGEEDVYTTLSQSFTLTAKSRVTFNAAFLAFDYGDHNDSAYVRVFSKTTNQVVFASSVFAVGDQGHTSWANFSSHSLVAGDYVFEAGVRNVLDGDADYSSKLLVDGVAIAVPEPAQWALMLTGFGAIGGALRMRRRTAGWASAA